MLPKDIFVPLTLCIDQTRRALVIVFPCYGALETGGVIIIIIIIIIIISCFSWNPSSAVHVNFQEIPVMLWYCDQLHAHFQEIQYMFPYQLTNNIIVG